MKPRPTRWPALESIQNMNRSKVGHLGLSEAEEDAIMQTLADGFMPPDWPQVGDCGTSEDCQGPRIFRERSSSSRKSVCAGKPTPHLSSYHLADLRRALFWEN
jgi:hypothetical protein